MSALRRTPVEARLAEEFWQALAGWKDYLPREGEGDVVPLAIGFGYAIALRAKGVDADGFAGISRDFQKAGLISVQ
jgi:hypothetical protein